jgi:hypothetical protein
MNQEVMNIFNPAQEGPTFDRIRISLASPEKIKSWSFGRLESRRPLITVHSSLRRMVSFAPAYLDQLRTMNVFAVNTSE